ncbi:MAG: nickel pincer cofactor biosynthesis protein LarC [Acetivibrio sp.]
MNKTLYLECYAGISGDMTVGALLDLGADAEKLLAFLQTLHLEGYKIFIKRVKKCGLDACDFDVVLENGTSHTHRNLADIYLILDQIENASIKDMAKKMFLMVAKAEALAHGIGIEEVHFHEVGAIDSIIDIVSTAFCIDNLGIKEVVISELWEGKGQVMCQHGILPVPVPATLNIIREEKLKLKITDIDGEMVTPTGAAIAAALKTREKLPKIFRIIKTGMGAGKKNFEKANVLRAILIEEEKDSKEKETEEEIWLLETNIDDCSGEALAYCMEKLFERGVKDVFYTPIFMKKNRPAYLLQVLCEEEAIEEIQQLIFIHTTSIGIRKIKMERSTLQRRIEMVETPYGPVKIKICQGETFEKKYPEYESIKQICEKEQMDYNSVYQEVLQCAKI